MGQGLSARTDRRPVSSYGGAARKELSTKQFDVIALVAYINGDSAIDFCMPIHQHTLTIKIIMADMIDRELAEAKQNHIINDYVMKPVSVHSLMMMRISMVMAKGA